MSVRMCSYPLSHRHYSKPPGERVMPPTLHCVRHAQGFHNLKVENHSMHDPLLTPFGETQCAHLASSFPNHTTIDLLVCSPLRRTIYTTALGFKPDIERGVVPIIALPEAQETSDLPCDTGSDPEVLTKEFAGAPVDLSRLTDGWNVKKGRWAPEPEAIEKRARETRQWLKARPEKEIVLVTHGGFLHYLTEDWQGFVDVAGTGWRNVEYRSYQFKEDAGDNASLEETSVSREMRRGTEHPLGPTERMELRETMQKRSQESNGRLIQAKQTKLQQRNNARDWIGAY